MADAKKVIGYAQVDMRMWKFPIGPPLSRNKKCLLTAIC